jgi:hypothetical protein
VNRGAREREDIGDLRRQRRHGEAHHDLPRRRLVGHVVVDHDHMIAVTGDPHGGERSRYLWERLVQCREVLANALHG